MIFFFQKSKLQKLKNFDPLFQIAEIEFFDFFFRIGWRNFVSVTMAKNTSVETASKTVIGVIYFETDFRYFWSMRHSGPILPFVVKINGVRIPCSTSITRWLYFVFFLCWNLAKTDFNGWFACNAAFAFIRQLSNNNNGCENIWK